MNIKIKNSHIDRSSDYFSVCVFFHFTNNGAQNISEQISLYYVLIFLNAQSLEWYYLVNMHMHFKFQHPLPDSLLQIQQIPRPPSVYGAAQYFCQCWCPSVFLIFANLLAKE